MPTVSPQFASSIASGKNWRDCSKHILKEFEDLKLLDHGYNFGILYVTDYLSDDLSSILNIFRSVLKIEQWIGSVAMGVCGNGIEYIDQPAISVMIGKISPDYFQMISPTDLSDNEAQKSIDDFMASADPMLTLTHIDPMMPGQASSMLKQLDKLTGGFVVGGLSSSRNVHAVISDGTISEKTMASCLFSDQVPVYTTMSQGCKPIGDTHTITKCEAHTILELDGRKAVDVFEEELRLMLLKKYDIDTNAIRVDEHEIPEQYQDLFKGEVQIALPVHGSDKRDYMVRMIVGVDEENAAMQICQEIDTDDQILFVYRDDDTMREDLSKSLVELRKRVTVDQGGTFEPRGALYISCVARAFCNFGDEEGVGEMSLIRDIIGDVPITGFYAGGEAYMGCMHGYTGVLILFL